MNEIESVFGGPDAPGTEPDFDLLKDTPELTAAIKRDRERIMNLPEIQARHNKLEAELKATGSRLQSHAQVIHDDRGALFSEHARLIRELAEERAACTIAGHAMDAMRATIDRKDEEIRLLRNVVESDEIICDGFGYGLDYSYARKNLAAFDKEHHA